MIITVRHLFVLECCANNILMYIEEIISPDHTGVSCFTSERLFFQLHCMYSVLVNILILKSVHYLVYPFTCIDFQGLFIPL